MVTDVHSSLTGVRAVLSRLSGMTGVESEEAKKIRYITVD